MNIQGFRPDRSAIQGHCGLRLLKNILTVEYMVCSTKSFSLFFFGQIDPEWPCSGSIGQKTSFSLPFGKRTDSNTLFGLIVWTRVQARAMSVSICSGSLDVGALDGLPRHRLFIMMPLVDNVMLWINALCFFLYYLFRKQSNRTIVHFVRGIFGIRYFDCWASYFEFGLFVNSTYLRMSYHVYASIGSWCAAFSSPSNCLLLLLRVFSGGVWAMLRVADGTNRSRHTPLQDVYQTPILSSSHQN